MILMQTDFLTMAFIEQTSLNMESRDLDRNCGHHSHTYVTSHHSRFIRISFSTLKTATTKGYCAVDRISWVKITASMTWGTQEELNKRGT